MATCSDRGGAARFMTSVLSSDWRYFTAGATEVFVNVFGRASMTFGVFYFVVVIILVLFAIGTSCTQFMYIMRPCLMSAKKRGYWKDNGVKDRNRYRLRWTVLSLYAMFMTSLDFTAGVIASFMWPFWFIMFFGMLVNDMINTSYLWITDEPYPKYETRETQQRKRNKHNHSSSHQFKPSQSAAKPKKKSFKSRFAWIVLWPMTVIGWLVLWPMTTIGSFLYNLCYLSVLRPIFFKFGIWPFNHQAPVIPPPPPPQNDTHFDDGYPHPEPEHWTDVIGWKGTDRSKN